jgi:photosystem II stability/assembly factor-like uncharacterized protein
MGTDTMGPDDSGTEDGADDDGGTEAGDGDGDPPMADCDRWELKAGVPGADWYDVTWRDAQNGFVVGTGGSVIATSDAGASWAAVNVGTSENLRSVDFAPEPDSSHGWIIGGEPVDSLVSGPTTMKATTDGGQNWTSQSTSIFFPPTRVRAIDAQRAWAVWGLGEIHPDGHWNRTLNGGAAWTGGSGDFLRPGRALMDVFFLDDQVGWTVGSNTQVIFSIDGQPVETPIHGAGKIGGIIHTKDGGNTWELQKTDLPEGNYFMGIHFVDHDYGWVVDERGNIVASEDGGASWSRQDSGVTSRLLGVRFQDPSLGWVVGDGGVLLETEDGGQSWKPQDSGSSGALRRLAIRPGGTPWAVGDGGVLLECVGE